MKDLVRFFRFRQLRWWKEFSHFTTRTYNNDVAPDYLLPLSTTQQRWLGGKGGDFSNIGKFLRVSSN